MNTQSKSWFSQDFFRFFLLFSLFFISSFVYNIILPLKKTVIMYIPGSGSESLAYLKPLFITPGSILMTSLFLQLSSRYTHSHVFRLILGIFTGYFALYRFVLTPYRSFFVARSLGASLYSVLPINFYAVPPLFEFWMDTLFYTMAELWGTTIISLIIWGFVNQNMTHQWAQSHYGLLTIGANSSAIVSGFLSLYLGKQALQWDHMVDSVLNIVLIGCGCTWGIYELVISQGGISNESLPSSLKKVVGQKSYNLLSCFRKVYAHRRLWAIAVIVVGYNTLYTLSEFMFIKQVELYYGAHEKLQSNALLSLVSLYTGVSATLFAVLGYPIAMRFGGWLWVALLSPLCFFGTGMAFYGTQYMQFTAFTLFSQSLSSSVPLLTGAIHIAMLRGARYSVFDATKETAYVGLPVVDQVQGKAAIDTIASRFGKSLGSFVYCTLFAVLGNSITATIPYIMLLAAIGLLYWIRSIWILHTIRSQDLKDLEDLEDPNSLMIGIRLA